MTTDHKVTLLTLGIIPLLIALVPLASQMMKRHNENQDKKRLALEQAAVDRDEYYSQLVRMREMFQTVLHGALRTIESAITRLDTGGDKNRVVSLLEELRRRLEAIELPPLPERD